VSRRTPIIRLDSALFRAGVVLCDLVFAALLVGVVFLGVVGVFDYFIPWASELAR